MLQSRTEVATKRKEMGNKRPLTQLLPRNQSHNMKSSYKQQSGHNLKTHVATQKLEEYEDNDVATCN